MAYLSDISGYLHKRFKRGCIRFDKKRSRTINYWAIRKYVRNRSRRGDDEDSIIQAVSNSLSSSSYRCRGRFYLPMGFRRAYKFIGNLFGYSGLYGPCLNREREAVDRAIQGLEGSDENLVKEANNIKKDIDNASSYYNSIQALRGINLIGGYKTRRLESRIRRHLGRRYKDLSTLVSDGVSALA